MREARPHDPHGYCPNHKATVRALQREGRWICGGDPQRNFQACGAGLTMNVKDVQRGRRN